MQRNMFDIIREANMADTIAAREARVNDPTFNRLSPAEPARAVKAEVAVDLQVSQVIEAPKAPVELTTEEPKPMRVRRRKTASR